MSSFVDFSILFCPRTCNRMVHVVAALNCKCPQGTILLQEGTPLGLEELVISDCANSLS